MRRTPRSALPVARRRVVVCAGLVCGVVASAWSLTPAAPTWLAPPASATGSAVPGTVAQRPDDATLNAANGEVRALAQIGNHVYLGGTFTKVGPAELGAAGVLRTARSTFAARFPDVVGAVLTAVGDGRGGWFVGGDFTSVGGKPRTDLAHVLANGRVAPWHPRPDAAVRALVRTTRGVVVAGDFTHVSGHAAARLVTLDARTGRVLWNAGLNGAADALAVAANGKTVYAGGSFTFAGPVARNRLVAVSAATGHVVGSFHPSVDASVRALAVDRTTVWLGGDFATVAGQTRHHLARVSVASGAVRSTPGTDGTVLALRLDASHHRLFVAGSFDHVAGRVRPRLAAIATATGRVGAIHLTDPTGDVRALTIARGALYLAGDFQESPEKTAPGIVAKVPLVSGVVRHAIPFEAAPASLTRHSRDGGGVFALAVGPAGRVLVGGDFSDYGLVQRRHLAAFDVDTGALDRAFHPTVDGPVYTLRASPSGSALFLGGAFHTVDGRHRKNLARIGSTRGALDVAFRADANAFVKDLAVSTDGRLYVAGPFVSIGGVAARHLAAVSVSSGHVLADFDMPVTDPTNDVSDGVRAITLSPDGATLAVVGNFRRLGGVDRPLVALINVGVSPARVRSWRTTLYDTPCGRGRVGLMRDVAISPDGSQLYVVSAGGDNPPACDSVNAFPVLPNHADVTPQWTARIGDSIETVTSSPGTVYVGGHFRVIDRTTWTDPRYHIAALDAATGRPLSWQPDANGFRGVRELEMTSSGLLAGSDGEAFGQVAHGRLAVFAPPPSGLQLRVTGSRSWVPPAGASVTYDVTVSNTSGSALTVTELTDNRTGNLDGAGTCAIPATVAPDANYTCHYSDQVSGKAGTGVKRTVTATTATTSATDEVKTTMVADVPTLRLGARTSPTRVPQSGASVRVAVTLTNLDPDHSVVVKQLTSNRWGSLTSVCGLPVTVAPNASVWCRLDRRVSGSANSWVPLTFNANGVDGPDPFTADGQVRVRVTARARAHRHASPG